MVERQIFLYLKLLHCLWQGKLRKIPIASPSAIVPVNEAEVPTDVVEKLTLFEAVVNTLIASPFCQP